MKISIFYVGNFFIVRKKNNRTVLEQQQRLPWEQHKTLTKLSPTQRKTITRKQHQNFKINRQPQDDLSSLKFRQPETNSNGFSNPQFPCLKSTVSFLFGLLTTVRRYDLNVNSKNNLIWMNMSESLNVLNRFNEE